MNGNSRITVALLQLTGHDGDLAGSLRLGDEACRKAAAMRADVALFPEMWSCGYNLPEPDAPGERAWLGRHSLDRDADYILHFRTLAVELQMAIAVTYLEAWPGAPRNTVSLIDRNGEIALTYAKAHTCDFSREACLTPGDSFPVAILDTQAGPVSFGAMICYDREFPESARLLMLGGAEIILVPNACTMDPLRLAQLQVRAFENMVGIAMTNYAAPRNNGRSVAFDGMATEYEDGPMRDMIVAQAGTAPGICLATFPIGMMREYRNREAWADAYRKPKLYTALSELAAEPPFYRSDARGR